MPPPRKQKSSAINKKVEDSSTNVLTLRINSFLDDELTKISEKKRSSKASVIREYLDLVQFYIIDRNGIKSLNENDLVVVKKDFLRSMLEEFEEAKKIDLGTSLARYINDLARLQGKIDDIDFKLTLCEKYGFFPKFIDKEGYILVSNDFGPKKFVEAFVWILITKGDRGDYNKEFIDLDSKSSKIRARYDETIQPVHRDASYYAFEFAKLK